MAPARDPAACTAIVPFAAEGPAALLQALADERMRTARTVIFPPGSAIGQLPLKQLPGKALGAYAWTAGVELACYLERHLKGKLSGLRALELGSGTGVTAIALARLGARVTATDLLPELVDLIKENAELAGLRPGRCTAKAFSWGEPLKGELLAPFDLVLGSEITYNEAGFQPLFETLQALCETSSKEGRPPPLILVAETLRNPQQQRFWATAGAHFSVREVFAVPQRDGWNVRDEHAPVRIFEMRPRDMPTSPLAALTPSAPADAAGCCPRVSSMADALAALRERGACILEGCGKARDDAAALPGRLFGDRLRAAPEPAEVSDRVLSTRGIKMEETFRAHTDGHAYGDLMPDYFMLLCAQNCAQGGGNFLVDGYAMLDELGEDPAVAWAPSALEARKVDQTSRVPSVTPVVMRAPDGRRALRLRMPGPPTAFAAQRPSADSQDPERDAEMLGIYHSAAERGAAAAPRVRLGPGDALLVDNYRMFHGRDPYSDGRRLLWRVWIWTDGARGVPEGELQSTPGDKAGAVTKDVPGSQKGGQEKGQASYDPLSCGRGLARAAAACCSR